MPGRPRKGRRFGGSSAHQKAIMGNLVASLIAAEAIVTTEAKAKAMKQDEYEQARRIKNHQKQEQKCQCGIGRLRKASKTEGT